MQLRNLISVKVGQSDIKETIHLFASTSWCITTTRKQKKVTEKRTVFFFFLYIETRIQSIFRTNSTVTQWSKFLNFVQKLWDFLSLLNHQKFIQTFVLLLSYSPIFHYNLGSEMLQNYCIKSKIPNLVSWKKKEIGLP